MEIRLLQQKEIPLVEDFPPGEWNFDIVEFMNSHLGKKYFYAIVAELDEKIVGIANAITNGSVSWLGNIIVPEKYRRKGIGKALTNNLIAYSRGKECSSIVLVATELGEKVYSKLGFRKEMDYVFFESKKLEYKPVLDKVEKLDKNYYTQVLELDHKATAENRHDFLKNYLAYGWIYKEKNCQEINGYFLPGLGNGLIVANNTEAGVNLLQFKHSMNKQPAVVPASNTKAIDFLVLKGFTETDRLPKMFLNKEPNWRPDFIYSRGAGYCG